MALRQFAAGLAKHRAFSMPGGGLKARKKK
jgi:hypothetical protein